MAGLVNAVIADSSTPRLASYYDRNLVICAGDAFEWSGGRAPVVAMRGIAQVGVGKNTSYALDKQGQLHAWNDDPRKATLVLDAVKRFSAGDSGVLAIRTDDSLWNMEAASGWFGNRPNASAVRVASGVKDASVGDGTNYYVALDGDLYAKGNADRGQYGDGRLAPTHDWTRVASGVAEIRSHTGHAILRNLRGEVQGTGGNIYGPVGKTGLGEKATRWTIIVEKANAIATGASHSLAIGTDQSLWIWGRNENPEPRKVLEGVIGAAAGSDGSIALSVDGTLWQWKSGTQPRKLMECMP